MIPMSSNNTSLTTTVPAFIAKLWHMVSDKGCDDLISWSEDGTSFVIKDQVRFCSQLLPRYYKHNNMASFIRQLNKYGFHKISSIESSSLRNEKGDYEFAHEFFVKDCIRSLEMIKRKMTTTSREIVDIRGDMAPLLQQLLIQVQELKDNHENVEAKIATMKRENDALWREHSVLRQKYVKQQTMINQLIQFLVTLVQQTRGVNRSRGGPIILKDVQQTPLRAIEAKKRDDPVISEIGRIETMDPKVDASSKFTVLRDDPSISQPPASNKFTTPGGDPSISQSPNYLINSPIGVEADTSAMLFSASESPGDPATLELSNPTFSGEPVIWCDGPIISDIQSLSSPLNSFDIDSPSSSKVNLTMCPQDVTPSIITSATTGSSQKNTAGKGHKNTASKKPLKLDIPVVVKQEKVDPPLCTADTMLNTDETDPSSTTTAEPELIDYQRQNNKRKEPDDSSSLVRSDVGSRQELENHLDVVQSDLDSLKDILQGLDTSAFMSLFNEQDPIGLNMPEASNNKQQLVSMYPNLIDISDMLTEEDGDQFPPPSPIDTAAIDSLLNTPQPTPKVEPHFTPKRFKK